VESTGAMDILNGGTISNSTSGSGDAGNITVKAGALKIEGINNILSTGIYALSTDSGNSGNINVDVKETLSLLHGGAIDTSTFSLGKAGDITVKAAELRSDGKTDILQLNGQEIPLGRFFYPSGIFSIAKYGSSGQTGSLNITATHLIQLSNLGKMSIENQSSAVDPTKIEAGNIVVNSADIDMEGSEITSNSAGNVTAGNIVVNFTHQLNMDSSFISTTANSGDGGKITINGGELTQLKNSGFITTVSGRESNGGDIFNKTDTLVMNSGLIQANAVSGSGGDISLNLKALIPSGNTLLLGGATLVWQPSEFGFNLIQAASQTGVSGTVNVTAPQLNLSGIIANLGNPQFDTDIISQDYCGLGTGSSLTRTGAGGLKPKSSNQLLFGSR